MFKCLLIAINDHSFKNKNKLYFFCQKCLPQLNRDSITHILLVPINKVAKRQRTNENTSQMTIRISFHPSEYLSTAQRQLQRKQLQLQLNRVNDAVFVKKKTVIVPVSRDFIILHCIWLIWFECVIYARLCYALRFFSIICY